MSRRPMVRCGWWASSWIVLRCRLGEKTSGTRSTPAVDGHLTNYVDAPNRYGLPAF